MKALRTKVCTYAIALLASIGFATSTLAGSSDFSGIFIAGHAELNVVAIDGTHTDGGGDNGAFATQGTIGGFAPTAGWEAGFNLPLGDTFFLTVGYADSGGGSAAHRQQCAAVTALPWSLCRLPTIERRGSRRGALSAH